MTAPRQVLPGVTYLISRRCFDRMFLLRPSPLVPALFEYVLATKAKEYGVLLHAYVVLSNHWHCVLTDPRGRLPEFQRDLGSTVARALNAALGRWESFWAPGSYSAVALQTAEDVLDKMARGKARKAPSQRRFCEGPKAPSQRRPCAPHGQEGPDPEFRGSAGRAAPRTIAGPPPTVISPT